MNDVEKIKAYAAAIAKVQVPYIESAAIRNGVKVTWWEITETLDRLTAWAKCVAEGEANQ